jgi:Leucine-rich repeat (LRR) protein
MNSRFALIALSIAMAVLSLALVITAAGGTASSVSGEASGIEAGEVVRDGTDNRLLADRRPKLSQYESLSLTEPISIYLPLVPSAGFIDKAVERAALMAFYNSTNGDGWINNTGWGTEASFCEWYGVTCDENEHVAILDLDRNKISGTLPAEIGDLLGLTVLRLTYTSEDFNKGSCLYYYVIREPFPPEIGKLVNLQVLDLGYNQLTSLPPEIGNLVNLRVLDLGGQWWYRNQLTFLPGEISNLASLQVLDLRENQLTYLLPEIGNLASLQQLDLGNNRLSGPIPAYLSNLGDLNFLMLWGNTNLTCWETQEALDWALSLNDY